MGDADDRMVIELLMTKMLGRPLRKAKRGELMDIYRTIALRFGTEVSAPRMWRSRNALPRHVRRMMLAMLEERTLPTAEVEATGFDPAVLEQARELQAVFELTDGRGDLWRSLVATIQTAKTWAKRERPAGLRHVRPLVGRA